MVIFPGFVISATKKKVIHFSPGTQLDGPPAKKAFVYVDQKEQCLQNTADF